MSKPKKREIEERVQAAPSSGQSKNRHVGDVLGMQAALFEGNGVRGENGPAWGDWLWRALHIDQTPQRTINGGSPAAFQLLASYRQPLGPAPDLRWIYMD